MSNVENKLKELGVTIPQAATPAANYVPYMISGNQIMVSGQIPFDENGSLDGALGKLGKDFDIEQGQQIARRCAINIISQVKNACGGNLDKAKCLKLGIFVNSTPDFTDQPQVGNGASDLIADAFGDNGKHARTAVGVASLPRGVAVEIEAVFEIL